MTFDITKTDYRKIGIIAVLAAFAITLIAYSLGLGGNLSKAKMFQSVAKAEQATQQSGQVGIVAPEVSNDGMMSQVTNFQASGEDKSRFYVMDQSCVPTETHGCALLTENSKLEFEAGKTDYLIYVCVFDGFTLPSNDMSFCNDINSINAKLIPVPTAEVK